jgi:DNA-binding transcriptional ArsR family regulator
VIDRLRKEIQERLDQLLHEAERLRGALAALDPRGRSSATARPVALQPRSTTTRRRQPQRTKARRRTAPGATKSRVLGALSNGKAMTAGEVAAATGLARGTVSTTLSKLAKSGEVLKADRGYRLP